MTPQKALEILEKLFSGSVTIQQFHWSHRYPGGILRGDPPQHETQWRIWVAIEGTNGQHWYGKTLEETLMACLSADIQAMQQMAQNSAECAVEEHKE